MKKPTSIQRREPRVAAPAASTKTITRERPEVDRPAQRAGTGPGRRRARRRRAARRRRRRRACRGSGRPAGVVHRDAVDRPEAVDDDARHARRASSQSSRRRRPASPSASASRRGAGRARWCRQLRSPSVATRGVVVVADRVEVLLEHLQRGGRGGGAAVAAVLDHGADDDRRRVVRAVAAPPRLRQVLRRRVARQRDELLGAARLAGDVDRELAEHAGGGAERRVRRLLEAALHVGAAPSGRRRSAAAARAPKRRSTRTGWPSLPVSSTSSATCGVTSLPPFAIIA